MICTQKRLVKKRESTCNVEKKILSRVQRVIQRQLRRCDYYDIQIERIVYTLRKIQQSGVVTSCMFHGKMLVKDIEEIKFEVQKMSISFTNDTI